MYGCQYIFKFDEINMPLWINKCECHEIILSESMWVFVFWTLNLYTIRDNDYCRENFQSDMTSYR